MKLYYSGNLNPRVAVAVARHLNAPVEYVRANPRDPANRDAFRPLNPNTLVPTLEEETGTLWETDAIACRLSQLVGSDFWVSGAELPEMIKWISWSTHHLTQEGNAVVWYRVTLPGFSDAPPDLEAIARGLAGFRENAAILDAALADREWLVGGRLTYADFRVATLLPFAKRAGLPVEEFPNVKRWNDQLEQIDAWRDPFAGLQ